MSAYLPGGSRPKRAGAGRVPGDGYIRKAVRTLRVSLPARIARAVLTAALAGLVAGCASSPARSTKPPAPTAPATTGPAPTAAATAQPAPAGTGTAIPGASAQESADLAQAEQDINQLEQELSQVDAGLSKDPNTEGDVNP